PLWIVSVFGLNADNPVVRVDAQPVWAEAGALAHSTAMRVTRSSSVDYLLIAEPVAGARPEASPSHAARVRSHDPRTWRIAEFETDAHMLFCRTAGDQGIARVALVDGSLLRSSSRHGAEVARPAVMTDLSLDADELSRATVSPQRPESGKAKT
ncbi:MAG TPA: hypothetical protein VHU82_04335, partial [Vicinamibacterales bacterium]|nr:hypothetical protein [Vicinamibacterales bacterium]